MALFLSYFSKTRKYLSIVFYLIVLNILFAVLTYAAFNGQISNAKTFVDYFYFGIATLTSTGYGDMVATTQSARLWVSTYILLAYSFIIYLAV